MRKVAVKEARQNFSSLLDGVEDGEEVILLRRGKEVARLVPPKRGAHRLPRQEAFRASIKLKGKPLSEEVGRGRRRERY